MVLRISLLWMLIIVGFLELGSSCSYRRCPPLPPPLPLLFSRQVKALSPFHHVTESLVRVVTTLRAGGGAIQVDDVETDGEEEDDSEDESDEESAAEDNEDEENSLLSDNITGSSSTTAIRPYDKMLVASPSMQMYSVIGVMLLSRKLDMFNPTVVRIGRFVYIAYVVLLQIFLLYVRFKAKSENNRTPIEMTNTFSKLLQSTQNSQVKSIASSFLTSKSTILEYDLSQVKSMNGGLLMNMGFLWFLHYKLGQTQPLYLQTVQGLMNLYFSPLFQVYVLGRNLERPFQNPTFSKVLDDSATTDDSSASETAEEEINNNTGMASEIVDESEDDESVDEDVDDVNVDGDENDESIAASDEVTSKDIDDSGITKDDVEAKIESE